MPIREGDGTGIASIREDDGTEIVEVREGDGTVLYSAGPQVTVVDDFEDGNISEYSGDTGVFYADGSSPVYNGSNSLKVDTSVTGFPSIESREGDGLSYYPQRGDNIRYNFSIESSQGYSLFNFFMSPGRPNSYYVLVSPGFSNVDIRKEENGNLTTLASQTATAQIGTEYRAEIDTTASDISLSVINVSTGGTLASLSVTDSTHTGRGIAFGASDSGANPEAVHDYIRVI